MDVDDVDVVPADVPVDEEQQYRPPIHDDSEDWKTDAPPAAGLIEHQGDLHNERKLAFLKDEDPTLLSAIRSMPCVTHGLLSPRGWKIALEVWKKKPRTEADDAVAHAAQMNRRVQRRLRGREREPSLHPDLDDDSHVHRPRSEHDGPRFSSGGLDSSGDADLDDADLDDALLEEKVVYGSETTAAYNTYAVVAALLCGFSASSVAGSRELFPRPINPRGCVYFVLVTFVCAISAYTVAFMTLQVYFLRRLADGKGATTGESPTKKLPSTNQLITFFVRRTYNERERCRFYIWVAFCAYLLSLAVLALEFFLPDDDSTSK